MKNVCLAVDRLSDRWGSVQKIAVTLANKFCDSGFGVTILTWEPYDQLPFYLLDARVRVINIMPIKMRRRLREVDDKPRTCLPSRKAPINRFLAYPAWKGEHGLRIAQLRTYFECAKPDAVIAFLPSSFPYVVEAASGTSVKVITSCHDVPESDFEDPGRWNGNPYDIWWRKECLRHSDAVTCLSDKFVPWFEKAGADNLHVIPNFVELPAEKTLPSERDSRTIVAVGRLDQSKDHCNLLRAWARLKEEFPDWKVHIYGDGPLWQQLRALHAELKLGDSVVLKGVTKDIDGAYRAAEIFCAPSLHEGSGLATMEAMAFGLPAVAFDNCDGTNEIITDGVDGLLVTFSGDRPSNLANALRRLVSNKQERQRLGRAARNSAERFEKHESVTGWIAALSSVGIEAPQSLSTVGGKGHDIDITIAIPVYNGEDGICRAIQSLQEQTFEGRIEILVCDDGSSDNTLKTLKRMQQDDPRIRILENQTNRGRPFTRQRLLDAARGEYLTWLDADDEKAPAFLSELYERLQELESEHPERICMTYCYFDVHYYENGGGIKQRRREVDKNFTVQLLQSRFEAYLWIFLVRTEHARLCQFDQNLPRLQDLDFVLQLSLLNPKLARTKTEESLCTYNKTNAKAVVSQLAAAWQHIYEKYHYILRTLGRGFAFRYANHAMVVTARYAWENGSYFQALLLRAHVLLRKIAFRVYRSTRRILRSGVRTFARNT